MTPKGEIEVNNSICYGEKKKPHHWAKIWSLIPRGPFAYFLW